MLAAMMVGGTSRTRVDLVTASPYTIPGGVTTIYLSASGQSGDSGPYSGPNGGGGGGAAWMLNVALAVTAGDVLTLTTFTGVGSGYTLASNLQGVLFNCDGGQSTSSGVGGTGGTVQYNPVGPTTASGGAGGTTGGATGGTGGNTTAVTVSGGILCGGGGGGGSGTVTGGAGGTAGGFAGTAGIGVYGGAGGGFNPGAQNLSGSTKTGFGTNRFCYLEY